VRGMDLVEINISTARTGVSGDFQGLLRFFPRKPHCLTTSMSSFVSAVIVTEPKQPSQWGNSSAR